MNSKSKALEKAKGGKKDMSNAMNWSQKTRDKAFRQVNKALKSGELDKYR